MTVTQDTTKGIPAGPRWPAWWSTWKFLKSRKETMPKLHAKYGDTFSFKILPGPRTFVIFSDPADVKEIFAADPSQFHAGEGNTILEPVMGSHSLLLTDDDEHKRSRKLLMPAFSGPTMKAYRPLIEAIAKAEVDSWEDGGTLVTLDRMNAITLDVILQVVFGVTDEERLAVLRPKVTKMVNIGAGMLLAWSWPSLYRVPPWRGYFKNQQEVDEILYAEIRERREELDRSANGLGGRADVLSRLLRAGDDDPDPGGGSGPRAEESTEPLSDEEMRDQLVTLLLAGHETTASALSWTLHELGRHPDLMKRAIEAADNSANGGDEAFLDACLKEAMRVHPVIDFVARTLQSDQVVAGHALPRKVTVTPSIMLSHSREANFADAHEYRPDRFLTQGEVAANTWIPFGGGVRRCIGAAFSLMEGAAVLGEVLRRYEVTADQPSPNRLRNITNVPDDKAPLHLRAR